ncbi:GGDEF domain-containing protein [Huintestinicola sp.]|uniref:GGDEF domain-containing protein n=1 Tax=Huintestinicola sp. TaxID=2981661 RepID=UPI003D7D8A31
MFNKLFDQSIDIKKRMFAVLAAAGLVSNNLGFAVNIAVYGVNAITAACGLCTLIIGAAGFFGLKTGKVRLPLGIILGLIIAFEFPMLFLAYGASTFPYMLLGLFTIIAFCDEKRRGVLFSAAMVYDGVIIGLRYALCDNIPRYDSSAYFGTGLSAFLISAAAMFYCLSIIIRQYEEKNKELKKLADELGEINKLDAQTGIYNRSYLTEYLNELVRGEKKFCAALIDLDNFSSINEKYGLPFGDMVITEFAGIINNAAGSSGIAARYGGQKFMIVCLGDVMRTEDMLENVSKEYAAFSVSEKQEEFTFSAGIEEYSHGVEISRIFRNAEEKLARAKVKGKNRVVSK